MPFALCDSLRKGGGRIFRINWLIIQSSPKPRDLGPSPKMFLIQHSVLNTPHLFERRYIHGFLVNEGFLLHLSGFPNNGFDKGRPKVPFRRFSQREKRA